MLSFRSFVQLRSLKKAVRIQQGKANLEKKEGEKGNECPSSASITSPESLAELTHSNKI